MRTRKSIINASINIVSMILIFFPNLIVRKLFLESLGADMLGLTSLYSNIIGWLSIAELGIGSAIIYSLYKPFSNNEYNIIRSYINYYKNIYRIVGIIILILGIIISIFIEVFVKGDINLYLARFGLILYLVNTFISYIFSHKICLLNLSQQYYKITIGTTISKLIIMIIQSIILTLYPNFIIYLLIQVVINLLYFIIINLYINKQYSWINEGKEQLQEQEKKELLKNIKAMFMHKIGSLIVFSTDNLIISKFIGLTELAKYTNYNTVIIAFQSLISAGLNGITASIGNLIAQDDKHKCYNIHKNIFFINFWMSSFIVISLYNTLNQFIVLWVGKESLINIDTLSIILVNLYFSCMRGPVEQFQSGSGKFYEDRYAPICEAIINLLSSLILVKYIGLSGVFIGTLISNLTVIFWTKPLVVYKYVFNKSIIDYFKMYFKYIIISIIPLTLTSIFTYNIKFNYTIYSFIINCIINIIVINLVYLIIFFKTEEFKYFSDITLNIIKKIKEQYIHRKNYA